MTNQFHRHMKDVQNRLIVLPLFWAYGSGTFKWLFRSHGASPRPQTQQFQDWRESIIIFRSSVVVATKLIIIERQRMYSCQSFNIFPLLLVVVAVVPLPLLALFFLKFHGNYCHDFIIIVINRVSMLIDIVASKEIFQRDTVGSQRYRNPQSGCLECSYFISTGWSLLVTSNILLLSLPPL